MNSMNRQIQAIFVIGARDFTKFLRDRTRIIATFMFPIIFIGVLGGSLQSNLGSSIGYNFLTFIFTGVLGQTLFQSTASGIISLIQDRETDFSQEMFVSPVSRFTIIFGKIVGESTVALTQGVGIIIFALIAQVPISLSNLAQVLPATFVACLLGGAFGVLVLSQLGDQRAANQIFPFVIFPQFFLSGVFSPIQHLPQPLYTLSRLVPMTYAVDLIRGTYYWGMPEYSKVVLHSPLYDLGIIAIYFVVMGSIGTFFFIRNEKNR